MKKKDLGVIGLVAVVSVVIAVVLSGFLIPSKERNQEVEVVQPINSTFERPPEAYFNTNSNNPTQDISIQEEANTNPFGSQQ